jgi:hypothetical protein
MQKHQLGECGTQLRRHHHHHNCAVYMSRHCCSCPTAVMDCGALLRVSARQQYSQLPGAQLCVSCNLYHTAEAASAQALHCVLPDRVLARRMTQPQKQGQALAVAHGLYSPGSAPDIDWHAVMQTHVAELTSVQCTHMRFPWASCRCPAAAHEPSVVARRADTRLSARFIVRFLYQGALAGCRYQHHCSTTAAESLLAVSLLAQRQM